MQSRWEMQQGFSSSFSNGPNRPPPPPFLLNYGHWCSSHQKQAIMQQQNYIYKKNKTENKS